MHVYPDIYWMYNKKEICTKFFLFHLIYNTSVKYLSVIRDRNSGIKSIRIVALFDYIQE